MKENVCLSTRPFVTKLTRALFLQLLDCIVLNGKYKGSKRVLREHALQEAFLPSCKIGASQYYVFSLMKVTLSVMYLTP